VADLSWLLERGYPERSSLALVGNRHGLVSRQRDAVGRSACSDTARADRLARRVDPGRAAGRALAIDGFNLLTTVESALGGGLVLRGRDGCLRDLASLHGTWRRVSETLPALELVRDLLAELAIGDCTWFLDRPISNSGRLRGWILEANPAWGAELVPDADAAVLAADAIAVSADRGVLDRCGEWFDLTSQLVPGRTPGAWLIDLSGSP
jgi:hypothetical protein